MVTPEIYYGFKCRPFDKNIAADKMFLSNALKELCGRLEYMKHHRGIILITGQSGTGKTTGLRCFTESLKRDFFEPVYIPLSTVNVLDFYRILNLELGGSPKNTKSALFKAIQNSIIIKAANLKKVPVIIIDEAHLLISENFMELQIILNFNMDSADPALIVISGQSHLKERLMRSSFISFNQRISLRYEMLPLSKEEVPGYIQHHLKLAGARENIFTEIAVEAIYKNTSGVPRQVGELCYKALMLGALEEKDTITEEEIFQVCCEM